MSKEGVDGGGDPDELAREFERRVMQLESTVREAHDELFQRLKAREEELSLRDERIETIEAELKTVGERVEELEAELDALRPN